MGKNYLWVFIEKFGVILIKFIFMMILARLILPKDFGIFSIANYIIMTATVLVESGMGGSLIRKKNSNIEDYSTVNIFNIVSAIVIAIILCLISNYLADYYHFKEMALIFQLMSICLIFRGLAVTHIAYMSKKLLFKVQSLIFIISSLIAGSFAVGLALLDFGYWALVAQQVIEAILIFLFFKYVSKDLKLENIFSYGLFKQHFSFGTKLSLSSFLDSLSINLIVNQIKFLGNLSYVGKYTQVSRINELFVGVITSTVDKAALPLLVERNENMEQMKAYTIKLLNLLSFVCYLLITYIICCAPEIIRVILGKNWVDAAWMLKIISYCGFMQIIELVLRSVLKAQGASNIILSASISKIIILALILSLTVNLGGIKVILNSLVIISILNIFMYLFIAYKAINIDPLIFIKPIIKPLICAMTTIIIMDFIPLLYTVGDSIFNIFCLLIIKILIISILYLMVAKALKVRELIFIIDLLLGRVSKGLAKNRKF